MENTPERTDDEVLRSVQGYRTQSALYAFTDKSDDSELDELLDELERADLLAEELKAASGALRQWLLFLLVLWGLTALTLAGVIWMALR